MISTKDAMRLYAVTDRKWVGRQSLTDQVESALRGGCTCIQLREKTLSEEEFLHEAIEIRALCNQFDVPFIVNDNVEIALKSGADGVHVGQSDMAATKVRELIGEHMILGVSTHTVEESLAAQAAGADYLGVGAIYQTATKDDAEHVSLEGLKEICDAVNLPVTAIGGLEKDNISTLAGTGVDGVALVHAIFGAEDIEKECRELLKITGELVEQR